MLYANNERDKWTVLETLILPAASGRRALSLGVGEGDELLFLLSKNYKADGVGIHLCNHKYLHEARAKGCNVWEQDIEIKPLNAEPYDLILCSHTIEHIYNYGYFFENTKKMLKPDGIIIFIVPPYCSGYIMGHIISSGFDIFQLAYMLTVFGFNTRDGHFMATGNQIYNHNVFAVVQKIDGIRDWHRGGNDWQIMNKLMPTIMTAKPGMIDELEVYRNALWLSKEGYCMRLNWPEDYQIRQ